MPPLPIRRWISYLASTIVPTRSLRSDMGVVSLLCDELGERMGRARSKRLALAGGRMIEREARRMQRHAADRIGSLPVDPVADDRMALLGELNANLGLAPRHESDLDERARAAATQDVVVRDRLDA